MIEDLITFVAGRQFGTVLVDPPWRFANRTGKMAPEHKRLSRYVTISMEEIAALPVESYRPSLPLGAQCAPAVRSKNNGSMGV